MITKLTPAQKEQKIAELEKRKAELTVQLDEGATKVEEARAKIQTTNIIAYQILGAQGEFAEVTRLENEWILLMREYETVVEELADLQK